MIVSELYNFLSTAIEDDYAYDYEVVIEIPDGLGTQVKIERCYLDRKNGQILLVQE